MTKENYKAMENRARRVAKSAGLRAMKSRNCYIKNEGGFQLINIYRGYIVAGREFELTADDVIDFCRHQWPEESKFALGTSSRWDEYHGPPQPKPAKIIVRPEPSIFQVPATATIRSCPQAEPALPEISGETKSDLKNWQLWGFPGGVKDLELTSRPGWILTFEEVYKDLGYKSVRGLKASLKTFDYPEEALAQERITKAGCRLLKIKKQNNRCTIKQRSAEKTRPKKSKSNSKLGTT